MSEIEKLKAIAKINPGGSIKILADEIAALEAELAAARQSSARLRIACTALLAYRKNNTLNFQLEKADAYFEKIRQALEAQP